MEKHNFIFKIDEFIENQIDERSQDIQKKAIATHNYECWTRAMAVYKELGKQIAPLKRQSDKAIEYKRLKELGEDTWHLGSVNVDAPKQFKEVKHRWKTFAIFIREYMMINFMYLDDISKLDKKLKEDIKRCWTNFKTDAILAKHLPEYYIKKIEEKIYPEEH